MCIFVTLNVGSIGTFELVDIQTCPPCRPGDHFKYRILQSESNEQATKAAATYVGVMGWVVECMSTYNVYAYKRMRSMRVYVPREHILDFS